MFFSSVPSYVTLFLWSDLTSKNVIYSALTYSRSRTLPASGGTEKPKVPPAQGSCRVPMAGALAGTGTSTPGLRAGRAPLDPLLCKL